MTRAGTRGSALRAAKERSTEEGDTVALLDRQWVELSPDKGTGAASVVVHAQHDCPALGIGEAERGVKGDA